MDSVYSYLWVFKCVLISPSLHNGLDELHQSLNYVLLLLHCINALYSWLCLTVCLLFSDKLSHLSHDHTCKVLLWCLQDRFHHLGHHIAFRNNLVCYVQRDACRFSVFARRSQFIILSNRLKFWWTSWKLPSNRLFFLSSWIHLPSMGAVPSSDHVSHYVPFYGYSRFRTLWDLWIHKAKCI